MLQRLLLVMAAVAAALPAGAFEPSFLRHPAPSPDGSRILFSWQGDLWLVPSQGGVARRLTAHPAEERHPVWSRGGRLIAFSSDRFGTPNVFVMPADASAEPVRLTFFTGAGRRVSGDTPVDFSADGTEVYFTSHRAETIRRSPGLYRVPITGGTPAKVQEPHLRFATLAADGMALAYVRGGTQWTRRGYRGAANRDLWLRTADGDHVQLTDFDGDDDLPTWIDPHTLAFLSARSGRKNVFRLDLVTREALQLTSHDGSDVRFPRASADGSLIAYEFEDGLWTVPADGGDAARLRVVVPAGMVSNPVERRTFRNDADELAISPDGRLAAFVVRGEVYVAEIMSKEDQEIAPPRTVQVTATAARERGIAWAPDGEALAVASARHGSDDIFLLRPGDPDAGWLDSFEFPAERLTDLGAEEHSPSFSPDGSRILYHRGSGDLVVLDLAERSHTVLLEHWQRPDTDWSPDGRFIAYSIPDLDYNQDVWIVPSAGGEPYNVSRHPDDDVDPRWSPDGRRLIWRSRRHADSFDVWGVFLTRADHERGPREWLRLWQDERQPRGRDEGQAADARRRAAKESADAAGENADAPKAPPQVVIDFDGLWERARAVTRLEGDEGPALVTGDGKAVVFTAEHEGDRDLYKVRWDGEDLERLTTGDADPSAVHLADDGKTLFYLDGDGRIKRVGLDGKGGDPVPFDARMTIDHRAERAAIFDEAWRALNESFYDPDFHGVDWKAQAEQYRPWALAASSPEDFADVMNLMLGELNASHMGYRPTGGRPEGVTGWIGAVFDPTAGGPGLLVTEVLRDSPADAVDVALAAGERLLAVDGIELGPGTNVYELFADTPGRRVRLRILAADGTERTAVVTPADFEMMRTQRYRTWVDQRRALVEAWSGGRLGYLHIEAMDMPSYEEFERQLYAAGSGKEGLVIDVRSNGGGFTTDYLMAALMVKRHAYTVPRGGPTEGRGYPQSRLPLAAWTRPALTLCDEESYSNAEIFSWAFKTLERGLLVGMPTFGAVISTGGTRLLNGALVRLPGRGWYVAGSGTNMELNGAVPDVLVPQPPEEDTASDRDTQLRRAVEVFLENLEDDPRYGAW